MGEKRIIEPLARSLDLAYCRRLVRKQISAVERGVPPLRIPKDAQLMQRAPGLHFHLLPEVNFQISGSTSLHMPSRHATMPPGTTSILRRGLPHRAEPQCRKKQPFLLFVVEHFPAYLGVILAQGKPGGWPLPVFRRHFPPAENPRLVGYLDHITAAWDRRSAADRKTARGLLLAYWAGLWDVMNNDPQKTVEGKSEHPQVARCKQLVMGNLSDPNLSVRRLARWIHLAPDYLSHLFRRETGMPLKAYINEKRIALARDLLDDRALNISEIAWATGYSDPGYFTRVFKRSTGHCPRDFRDAKRSRS